MMETVTLRDRIAALVRAGLESVQAAGALPAFEIPDPIPVEPSRHEAHGDYSSPVCMGLARLLKRAPLQIAQAVLAHLPQADFVAKVDVAAPGYLNFALSEAWLAEQVPVILAAGENWGQVALGAGKRIQVEFVSANPTGPLTVGSTRNAVLGDAIAAVLQAAGYTVEREYYINDAGSKVRAFGESILSRYADQLGAEIPFPENGYPGAYVTDLAQRLAAEAGRSYLEMERAETVKALTRWGIDRMLEGIKTDLEALRIRFDSWYHERWLYERGLFDPMMERLSAAGALAEHDDATWLHVPELEKDAVLVRSPRVVPDPEDRPTYLASDAVYLWDKLVTRGFDRAVYIWGADHHGDVERVLAAARAQGLDSDRLSLILYQLVTLLRNGEIVRMSKSSGQFVTLRELVDEVGPDPIRFMMLTRSADSRIDFDLDLVKEQSDRNPVYYVQYAHTRIAGVLRHAGEQGWDPQSMGDPALLVHPSELALIRKMLALPEVITLAAGQLAPHHLTGYATELASLFHAFYRDCRVVSSDPADAGLTRTRLMLARSAQGVLARVLHLMGMDAPERM